MTRLNFILGAEVAKAVGCKVEGVDKEFVLDVLLQNSNINEEATARIELRRKRFREDMVNRQE
ncbi:conjugal transfer protein TraD [Salmonella enterica]|nr:conjugal transfer protein TraD [Citrobacter sp. Cu096]MDL3689871.1 conjugal transfer protein TraD [Salmonella enterica]MDM2741868.1 conjugal transfer protein TraD [Citrobacter sp. Cu096]